MINASELRIGNLVGVESRPGMFAVMELKNKSVTLLAGPVIRCAYENIIPLPITEEWLSQSGLQLRVHHWNDGTVAMDCYWSGDYYIRYETLGSFIGKTKIDNSACFLKTVKSVHDLQNIYFAMSGEELKTDL